MANNPSYLSLMGIYDVFSSRNSIYISIQLIADGELDGELVQEYYI